MVYSPLDVMRHWMSRRWRNRIRSHRGTWWGTYRRRRRGGGGEGETERRRRGMKLKCRQRRVGEKGLQESVCKGAHVRGRNCGQGTVLMMWGGYPPSSPPFSWTGHCPLMTRGGYPRPHPPPFQLFLFPACVVTKYYCNGTDVS